MFTMDKEILAIVKLQIEGGKANPAPPIGSVLGQRQVNIMDFCKKFNEATKDQMGILLPVEITIFTDKTFEFKVKQPSMTYFIKSLTKCSSLSKTPGRGEPVAALKKSDVLEALKQKMPDLNCYGNLESAMKMFIGSARSAGVEVVD